MTVIDMTIISMSVHGGRRHGRGGHSHGVLYVSHNCNLTTNKCIVLVIIILCFFADNSSEVTVNYY